MTKKQKTQPEEEQLQIQQLKDAVFKADQIHRRRLIEAEKDTARKDPGAKSASRSAICGQSRSTLSAVSASWSARSRRSRSARSASRRRSRNARCASRRTP